MFEDPVYVASSLNVVFPRVRDIRRRANEFEDRLVDRYGQPQSVPVPDELDPQVPRLVFQSLGGHSQIVISQVSISLSVTYDGEWTSDASKRAAYLSDRVPLVYQLCSIAGASPAFSGLTNRVRLYSGHPDSEILSHLVGVLGLMTASGQLSEASIRLSSVVEGRFFDNVTIQSFREWDLEREADVLPLPAAGAKARGIEFVQDFNDRYKFNETEGYRTSEAVGLDIVALARDSLGSWIHRIYGADAQ